MLVFFMLGVVVYEHSGLHEFVNDFKPVKVVAASVLFVAAESAFILDRGGKLQAS